MNHKLLNKLVFRGMQKNRKTLVPFLMAGTFTVMIFYILQSLAYCPYIYYKGVEAFYGAQTIAIILDISSQITAVFAVLFLFYANQFLIKGRKKEMGLYGVLGMSKKNITYIMTAETILYALISMAVGMMTGTFLNKLMLLMLYKIIGQRPVEGLFFSTKAFGNTMMLFGIIFACCLLHNVRSIRVGNPITLLQSNHTGEKEPKVKIGIFLLGVVTLAAGYYLALTAKTASEAINSLFISILLVVLATYGLFTAGSIFILKRLKKNPKFYYKTKNFISVSNLMFRMKHNAAGLASICILSTGVILLLTCGCSLMMLGEKNINRLYPTDVKIESKVTGAEQGQREITQIRSALKESGIQTSEEVYRQYKTIMLRKDGQKQTYADPDMMYTDMGSCIDTYLLSMDDYNKYVGTNEKLSEDQVLIYNSDKEWKSGEVLDFLGKKYAVAGNVDYRVTSYVLDSTMSLFESEILVFASEAQINGFLEQAGQQEDEDYNVYIGYQTNGALSKEQQELFTQNVNAVLPDVEIHFKAEERHFFYNIYGGAFFVGIFLAMLFLMATVLIIYYKQMSEGYEDQRRFQILSNVGLTEKEARKSIQTQVKLLFFLPVGAAMLHMMVASNVIRLFLRMVLVVDAKTFGMAIATVSIIFLLVYILVYHITSRTYYKIIHTKSC